MFKNLPEAYKFTTFVHTSKDLTGFLGKTRLSKEEINERIRHPITRVKYPARTMFVLLKKYVEDFFHQGAEPHMLCLAGLRGTGKTTLLWHTAEHIYQHITLQKRYSSSMSTSSTTWASLYLKPWKLSKPRC